MQNIYLFLLILFLLIPCSMGDENQTQDLEKIAWPGASALEIQFISPIAHHQERVFSFVDEAGIEIFRFSGNSFADNKILILNDVVYINLPNSFAKQQFSNQFVVTPVFGRDFQTFYSNYESSYRLANKDLKEDLYNKVKGHTSLGYRQARERMFGEMDNVFGYVECVYTGKKVKTTQIPDPTVMNCEHSWPKSKGAENEPALSDLHHLFPTDSYANQQRSNYPFGTVARVTWSEGGSALGYDAGGYTVFSPRTPHRGDVARSMFYFSIRYKIAIPSYEENVLKRWHREDPVDQKEMLRNDSISKYQRNRNPFVDRPELVDAIADF